jgi:hypothetical protein
MNVKNYLSMPRKGKKILGLPQIKNGYRIKNYVFSLGMRNKSVFI